MKTILQYLTLRRLSRATLLLLHVILGLLASLLIIFPARWLFGEKSDPLRWWIVTRWFRMMGWLLRLKFQVSGEAAAAPTLFVANHISWLDIPVLGAWIAGSFVSKAEVRDWPIVGLLCSSADTLFIKRGSRVSTDQIIQDIGEHLNAGRSILIFPEGTSTEGDQVLQFKRRLFRAALSSGATVQPVALCYPQDGEPNRVIPYTGDDTLLHNMMRLFNERETPVEINFLEPMSAEEIQSGALGDRDLAQRSWEQVNAAVLARYSKIGG